MRRNPDSYRDLIEAPASVKLFELQFKTLEYVSTKTLC